MILTIITFFIVLSILVLVHELGHFLVALKVGVRVEEFGLGLPPRAIGKKIKGIIYSLNWLPIGGFVKLAGEDNDSEEHPTDIPKSKIKEYFWARSKKERSLILIAGVAMNFLLSVAIMTGLFIYGVKESTGRVHIENVVENSPAYQAGLMVNDRVTAVTTVKDGVTTTTTVSSPGELIGIVGKNKGKEVTLTVVRNGQVLSLSMIPRTDYPKDQGPTGIAITDIEMLKYPWYQAPFEALTFTVDRAGKMLLGIGQTIVNLVTGRSREVDVAGPIGIAQVTATAMKFGFVALLDFISILSLNLAVLNILPIPALDGGRLAFVFIEKIIGRKIKPAFEKQTHQIGMLILLFLVLIVSLNDIIRLTRGG